ncbi:type VI secretion system Vgr family protein [Pseudozobellia sp. WGM2]|uniref:type VI secretion system Vgr family protein n=1 Tax=Pseudozobellia sp. WGM2 TaxID=2787625 RepID=UPI001AE0378E|nr:phage baseplate assembly protein V [Pseudozobellia sp. WGM2]
MALLSKTSIYIGGKLVPTFKHLYLNQQIDAHHTLEVVFRMDVFEKESKELGEKSKEFLGKSIAIQIGSIRNGSTLGTLEFKGIITDIKIVKGQHSATGDEIIIRAKSPTILADDGVHHDSFNATLEDIVSTSLRPYAIDAGIAPKYTGVIDYCVQQTESCFAFLRRLSKQYGEWFYYNGDKLIFGKPETKETELKYSADLQSFTLSLVPRPQKKEYYTNDYLNDEIHSISEQSKPQGLSALNGFVFDRSNEIYQSQTISWNSSNNSPSAKKQLEAKVKAQHECTVINEVVLEAVSSNPGVKLGNIVKIEGEKYRVIEIAHSTDHCGHYKNNFKAISGSFDAYPLTNINAFPKSASQVAIVKENHDPESMGRIKVQFPWQKRENKMTSWIRVLAVHAGRGKGFYSIPEIGEEVLIDFESGNAEVPYAAGCLFNANAKPPGNSSSPGNDNTILRTRSGCTLTLNDGDGSIKLEDKAGSIILLDGTGNVVISAVEQFNIDCKVGFFDARETLNVGSPDTTIAGDSSLWLTSDTELKADGGTATLEAKTGKAEVKGLTAEVNASTTATINGTTLTEIKGGQVKLN